MTAHSLTASDLIQTLELSALVSTGTKRAVLRAM